MTSIVIYSSKLGNSKKVAQYIASKIGAEAVPASDSIDLSKYNRVILGTGVYAGKPGKSISDFVSKNKDELNNASLFVTCMYDEDKGAVQLEKIAEELGIADAIFFNKVKKQIGVEGSKLETYIKSL